MNDIAITEKPVHATEQPLYHVRDHFSGYLALRKHALESPQTAALRSRDNTAMLAAWALNLEDFHCKPGVVGAGMLSGRLGQVTQSLDLISYG